MSETDPGLMVTQKLEPQKVLAEQPVPDADVEKVDQSFIEELDNSMAEEISPDQLKA